MKKTDFDVIKEYKSGVDQIEQIYGERNKAIVYHYLDTKGKDVIKKIKYWSIGLMVAGVILSPFIIGIPAVIVGVLCYFFLYKKAEKMSVLFREMAAEDPTLA